MWTTIATVGAAVAQVFRWAWQNPGYASLVALGFAGAAEFEHELSEWHEDHGRRFQAELHEWLGDTGLLIGETLGLVAGVSALVDHGIPDIPGGDWYAEYLRVVGVPLPGF